MATRTLTIIQVQNLLSFCKQQNKDYFMLVKSIGAYVGLRLSDRPEDQYLFYFPGCDPIEDDDCFLNSQRDFGGDDFAERLPLSWLEDACNDRSVTRVAISFDPDTDSVSFQCGD